MTSQMDKRQDLLQLELQLELQPEKCQALEELPVTGITLDLPELFKEECHLQGRILTMTSQMDKRPDLLHKLHLKLEERQALKELPVTGIPVEPQTTTILKMQLLRGKLPTVNDKEGTTLKLQQLEPLKGIRQQTLIRPVKPLTAELSVSKAPTVSGL